DPVAAPAERSSSGVELEEARVGFVHRDAIAGGDHVQQQSTRDGDAQPGIRSRSTGRLSPAYPVLSEWLQPRLHNPVEKAFGAWSTLECLTVQLEKQPHV